MNVQVRRQNPTYPPDVTMSLVGKEMYVCIGGDVYEIRYKYAAAWRDGAFEGFRALTCTSTVPLVYAPSCHLPATGPRDLPPPSQGPISNSAPPPTRRSSDLFLGSSANTVHP